jgi:hypothetical protein
LLRLRRSEQIEDAGEFQGRGGLPPRFYRDGEWIAGICSAPPILRTFLALPDPAVTDWPELPGIVGLFLWLSRRAPADPEIEDPEKEQIGPSGKSRSAQSPMKKSEEREKALLADCGAGRVSTR